MTTITFHIKLASDMQARLYAMKSSRNEFWLAQIDERHLTSVEREHLLRMAPAGYPKALEWNFPYDPVGNVYTTAYFPDAAYARLTRSFYEVSMRSDPEIARLIIDDADPLTIIHAAIADDRARFLRARAELERRLHDDIILFLNNARARIEELARLGADALTENEIERGHRPQKPGWYDAIVNERIFGQAIGNDVANAWSELIDRFDAARAEARARREEAKREAEARARDAEQRNLEEARAWIENFGSDRLKTLVERDLPFWREYVSERVRVEYPEFEPVTTGRKTWRNPQADDIPPTNEQIDLADRYNARIVMVTINPYGYSRIEPRVVIPEAFGGIDLIERDRDEGES